MVQRNHPEDLINGVWDKKKVMRQELESLEPYQNRK